MNLLFDQREEGKKEPSFEEPRRLRDEDIQPFDEEPQDSPILERSPDFYDYDQKFKRKRSIIGPVFLIIILLGAIVAAAYFGFFYKPKDKLRPIASSTELDIQPEQVTPSTGPEQNQIPQEQPAEVIPPTTETTSAYTEASSPQYFSTILSTITDDVRLNTLVLDETTFSMEVSANARSAIESFFAGLKAKIPVQLNFSPPSGYYKGARALISGSFSDTWRENKLSSPEITPDLVKRDIRSMATDVGVRVIEISTGKTIVRTDTKSTEIFVKVSGRVPQFETFFKQVLAKDWDLRLAKSILMYSPANTPIFVMRLEIVRIS